MIFKILFTFILFTIVVISASLTVVSAQMLPQNTNPTSADSPPPATKNPYGIRITDPTNGEKIFINGTDYFDNTGKKLALTGFSVANSGNLTNCDVSIVTNSIFPYQGANGTGPLGPKDFTKWTYVFSSDYANLHEGSNKITSKLTCEAGAAKAYYSVNVTGVKFNGTLPQPSTSLNLVKGQNNNISLPSSLGNLQSSTESSVSSTDQVDTMDMPALSIEILSPSNGETVNLDNPITVNGTSDYPQNYDCEVLLADGNAGGVIAPSSVNNSNFKKTTAKGVNGTGDYRDWSIVLEPDLTNLKNGSQSLTAKLQCYSPLSAIKFAKVNVDAILPQPDLSVMSIEILSPSNGETVNLDNPITVNGTSDYPQNYDCEVLLADGNAGGVIAPTLANNSNFKKTTAKGVNGTGDYRDWSIVLEPDLTNLKNGSQSLTAKLQCYSPLSAIKFAKVNVDVIPPKPIELKTMDVSIDKAGQGLNQRITIGANDATTNEPLGETTITGSINEKRFSGSTDTDGKYNTSIPQNVLESGETIHVSVTVTSEGYKLKKTSTSFEGIPVTSETGPAGTSNPASNRDEANNEADLADRIFDDVQKQLSDQGINIPLPFG